MKRTPLVSIRCTVYNHEPFLRQCLDGFVMQKTTFPFEAIVHDDASTDGSAAVIREYAEKYPDIIKPIYEAENQHSKHDGSLARIIDAAIHPDSNYIAYCEGDDYWTDPNKLQIQVDFLESHPDYYMTCHAFEYYYEDTKEFKKHKFLDSLPLDVFDDKQFCTPTINDFFCSSWFTQILTIVRRKNDYVSKEILNQYKSAYDYITCYYMLKAGKCALFKDVMGVYRKQSSGLYSGREQYKWSRIALDNYYTLYSLERDKRVLPLCDDYMSMLFSHSLQTNSFKEAIELLYNHFSNLPKKHFLLKSAKLIIKTILYYQFKHKKIKADANV